MNTIEGYQMIIDLQEAGGIAETEAQAREGWANMSDSARESTESAHRVVCRRKYKDDCSQSKSEGGDQSPPLGV